MKPVLFPEHWGYRRVAEVLVAIYASLLGAALIIDAGTLDWPMYWPLGGPALAFELGLVMMALAACHSWALWLNGRNPRLSRGVRILVCGSHAGLVIALLAYFAGRGAHWQAILMLWVFAHIYFALTRACRPASRSRRDP